MFTINLLAVWVVRCSCFLRLRFRFFHVLPFQGPSCGTMSTSVASIFYAMLGSVIVSLVARGSMKSPSAKAVASLLVTKKKAKATSGNSKTSPKWVSMYMTDVDEQSASTVSMSELQVTTQSSSTTWIQICTKRVLQMISQMQRTCSHISKTNGLAAPPRRYCGIA